MSVAFSIAKFELKEEFEKYLGTVSVFHLQKLALQRALTWQTVCIQNELKRRTLGNENLKAEQEGQEGQYSFQQILATNVWY